jgi:hypothetical protein
MNTNDARNGPGTVPPTSVDPIKSKARDLELIKKALSPERFESHRLHPHESDEAVFARHQWNARRATGLRRDPGYDRLDDSGRLPSSAPARSGRGIQKGIGAKDRVGARFSRPCHSVPHSADPSVPTPTAPPDSGPGLLARQRVSANAQIPYPSWQEPGMPGQELRLYAGRVYPSFSSPQCSRGVDRL